MTHQVVYGIIDNKYVFYSKKPKYNELRRIPLQKNLLRILQQYHDDTWEASKSSNVKVDDLTGFLFWSSNGNTISSRVLDYHFKRIREDYNKQEKCLAEKEERPPVLLPGFTPHVLRHTYCTRMAEAGMNIKVLQSIMGHKDVAVTMNVYNHVTMDRIMSQLPKIEKLEL